MAKTKEIIEGLFWTNEPNKRSSTPRTPKPPKEPAVLLPYVIRPRLQYDIATREELIAGAGGTMIFDSECFNNFFMIAFKDIKTKKVTILTAPFQKEKLGWIMQNYRCVGFNSMKYDLPLIWMAYADQDTALLKEASNDLIGVTVIEGGDIDTLKVTLDSSDIEWATKIAKLRNRTDLVPARGFQGSFEDMERIHIFGAAGELVFCRAMGVEWPAHVNTFASKPDVSIGATNFEIKTRLVPYYDLLLPQKSNVNRISVHITTAADMQSGPMDFTFLIKGWWDNSNALKDAWIQTHGGREAAHFIPMVNLNHDFSKWITATGKASKVVIKQPTIRSNVRPDEVLRKYDIRIQPTKHIDLIEVCPLHGSLKLYGARLHAKRIQDVPWANQQALEDWQIPITQDYCINDLDMTELLFNNLEEQLQLRTDLSKEYKQDLMSKSDAQIAETVIISELQRLTRRKTPRPVVRPGTVHRFVAPDNLFFKTEYMQSILKVVTNATFQVAETGYLIRPDEIKNLKIKLGGSVYRMGIGGLHSSEKTAAFLSDNETDLVDRDVASYYPRIVLNCQLAPKNLGKSFLIVYQSLVDRRLEAKEIGDLAVSENLKVAVNGTFGKTGSPYSVLYAPEVIVQILLGGQLYLLMLIERMEAAGIPVVSANTDGILMRCPKDKQDVMLTVVNEWESITRFKTEETRYKAVYARDVNCYLAVILNNKLKGKAALSDPWRNYDSTAKDRYWRFQKNPTAQICVEAIERFIVSEVPLEQTINSCTDITRFVSIKNVAGGAHKDGEYLGKVVRWYYAKDTVGTINYINTNRIVGDTEGAKPLMDLPDEVPADISYDYYVERCRGMLADMGWIKLNL